MKRTMEGELSYSANKNSKDLRKKGIAKVMLFFVILDEKYRLNGLVSLSL